MNYQHILVATDFSDKGEHTLQTAHDMAQKHGAKLSIANFIEPLPATAFSYASAVDFESQRTETAKQHLAKVGESLNIPTDDQHVRQGLPRVGIAALATDIQADLIIVGSHGHHPALSLLGSTASAVANHAHCDILIVR